MQLFVRCYWLSVIAAFFALILPGSTQGGDNDLQKELGPCVCDLTQGHCDAHCCCDPDCVALGLVPGFDCLPDGPANRSTHTCYSKGWVHNVNPRVDFWVVADDLRGLLCVSVDNNVIKGVYHQNEVRVAETAIDSIRAQQKLSSFGGMLALQGPSAEGEVAKNSRGYRVGDRLRVNRLLDRASGAVLPLSTTNELSAPGGSEMAMDMPLRSPDLLGACPTDSGQPIRFLVDVPYQTCWLGPVQLSDTCETLLNYRNSHAWLLRKLNLPEATKCGSRCIAPDVNSSCPWQIFGADGTTKSESPCTAEEKVFGRAAQFVRSGAAPGGQCACRGAVRDVRYTIVYKSDGEDQGVVISRLDADVTLQDIESSDCQPVRVPQGMSVRFLHEGSGVASAMRDRSGNPGYRFGLPLLVGTCARYDESNIQCEEFDDSVQSHVATVEGILEDGTCGMQSDAARGQEAVIHFGEDAMFGCTAYFTRQQLASTCKAGTSTGFGDLLRILPFGRLGGRWTHVAAFGALHQGMQEAGEWIEITPLQGGEALEFDEDEPSRASTSTCRNAIVGVDLEILYSYFGEVSNPQLRIVGARASRKLGNLEYTQLDPAQLQAFQFSFTVSFLQAETSADVDGRAPPKPQLPLWLPHDLFYPFSLSRSHAAKPSMPSLACTVLLLAVIALHADVCSLRVIGR